jgi:hypothetical protein
VRGQVALNRFVHTWQNFEDGCTGSQGVTDKQLVRFNTCIYIVHSMYLIKSEEDIIQSP